MFSSGRISNASASAGANVEAGDGSSMSTIQGIGGSRATRSAGMFYAYLFNTAHNDTGRMVITFASRAVADEWWRAVSTSNSPFLQNNVQRIAPQLYSHNTHQWSLISFFTEPQLKAISDNFRGLMFLVPDGLISPIITIIPTQPIVDHVSGKWFSIRSIADPSLYWYYHPGDGGELRGAVHYNLRTFFKVCAPAMQEGTIMIDDDDIIIIVQHHGFLTFRTVDESSALYHMRVTSVESEAVKFKFRDLEDGRFEEFEVGGWQPRQIAYSPHSKVSNHGWELAT